MNIKITYIIVVLFLLLNCAEKRVERKFHKNGNLSLITYFDSENAIDSLFEFYNNGSKKVLLKLNNFGKYDYKYFDDKGNLRVSGEKIGINGKAEFTGWVNFYRNDSTLKEEILWINDTLRVNQRKLYINNTPLIDSSTFYYYDKGKLNLYIERKHLYPMPGLCLAKELNEDFSNLNVELDTIAPNFIDKKNNFYSWNIPIDSLREMNGFFVIYYWELQNDASTEDSLRINEYHKNVYIKGKYL